MRGTKFSHMATWMNRLIFKPVGKVPPRLKALWYTVWVLFVTAVSIAAYLSIGSRMEWYKKLLAPLLTLAVFPTLLSALSAWAKSLFLNSAGDASRYFTPVPDNISERSHIRQQGAHGENQD